MSGSPTCRLAVIFFFWTVADDIRLAFGAQWRCRQQLMGFQTLHDSPPFLPSPYSSFNQQQRGQHCLSRIQLPGPSCDTWSQSICTDNPSLLPHPQHQPSPIALLCQSPIYPLLTPPSPPCLYP
ncbi:unnamed protein product [Lota lota]